MKSGRKKVHGKSSNFSQIFEKKMNNSQEKKKKRILLSMKRNLKDIKGCMHSR